MNLLIIIIKKFLQQIITVQRFKNNDVVHILLKIYILFQIMMISMKKYLNFQKIKMNSNHNNLIHNNYVLD